MLPSVPRSAPAQAMTAMIAIMQIASAIIDRTRPAVARPLGFCFLATTAEHNTDNGANNAHPGIYKDHNDGQYAQYERRDGKPVRGFLLRRYGRLILRLLNIIFHDAILLSYNSICINLFVFANR